MSFPTLLDALPDPVLVITASQPHDLTGRRYVLANAAARSLLRVAGEGLLVSAVRDPAVLEAADRALFGQSEAECVYETGGARPRTLRVQARPMGRGPDGAWLALLSFRDETELRRIERMRVDFLANASHELRTPLASLSGFIETLRGHARDDPAARQRFLDIMQAQAGRMARLIDDLASLSRIELNEHVPPRGAVDLSQVTAEAVEAAGPVAHRRDVRLELKAPAAGAAVIRGDHDQIVQVAQNLLDNAIKYSPEGGLVRVEVASDLTAENAGADGHAAPRLALVAPEASAQTYAALRVSDEGCGIPRQHLPRLSERFYRVEGRQTASLPGTGLGLAIVKHIVNRHRGGLFVASAEGEGSTFTAYFPLASESAPVVKLS